MSNLLHLKKAIVSAVPEIMELRFGCEVKVSVDASHADKQDEFWKRFWRKVLPDKKKES